MGRRFNRAIVTAYGGGKNPPGEGLLITSTAVRGAIVRKCLALFLQLRAFVRSEMNRHGTPWEARVGRGLAMCVHPYATFRTRSNKAGVTVVLAYAAASYVLVLGLLVLV